MDRTTPPRVLTHYYRPHSRPLRSLSTLTDQQAGAVLDDLRQHEPLPYRLAHADYLPERRRIEAHLRDLFAAKGGEPQRLYPHYFVLGQFSLWENDDSLKVQIPLEKVRSQDISFTLTDSFFNFRRTNLQGVSIPERSYHGEVFTIRDLAPALAAHDLPTDSWRSDPARRFEVYVEAQVWSDDPVRSILGAARLPGYS